MPPLSTHLSFPEIGEQMFLSRFTVKSQATSIYRQAGASTRNQGRQSPGPVSSGCRRDDFPVFHPIGTMELAPARDGLVPTASGGTQASGRA
jgi:hypothetical protein